MWVRVVQMVWIVGAWFLVSGISTASHHKYQCVEDGLCLGGGFSAAVKRLKQRGFTLLPQASASLCQAYIPRAQGAANWRCAYFTAPKRSVLLLSLKRRLVLVMLRGQHGLTLEGLSRRWGPPKKRLRAIGGTTLFWDATPRVPYLNSAFLPRSSAVGKKKPGKKVKKGHPVSYVFLFHQRRLAGTFFAQGVRSLQRLYRGIAEGEHWPNRCFHTLCLGTPRATALPFLRSEQYKRSTHRRFRGCKTLFSGAKATPRCEIWVRAQSQSVLRLVWRKGRLIFAQAERFARPLSVDTLRWLWGKEQKHRWVRGMLFLQWRLAKAPRYVLSIPLFGEKGSKTPLVRRRAVGMILLDWKALQDTKMGRSLRPVLGL